ncbi:MAG: hypothetical protein J6T90_00165 [Methanomicrobium sp.]|nr:hypothetical protein [Methanomicrobium sp.]
MDRATIDKLFAQFESCRHIDSGVELWMAKDLQTLLGYIDPRDFFVVVEKAKLACQDSRGVVKHNFVPVRKLVRKNGKVQKVVADHKLTRLACYYVANNCGFRSDPITFAQVYFAIPIRRPDIIEEHLNSRDAAPDAAAGSPSKNGDAAEHTEEFSHGMDFRGFGSISSRFGGKKPGSARRR